MIPVDEVPLSADVGTGVSVSMDKDSGDENASGNHLSLAGRWK